MRFRNGVEVSTKVYAALRHVCTVQKPKGSGANVKGQHDRCSYHRLGRPRMYLFVANLPLQGAHVKAELLRMEWQSQCGFNVPACQAKQSPALHWYGVPGNPCSPGSVVPLAEEAKTYFWQSWQCRADRLTPHLHAPQLLSIIAPLVDLVSSNRHFHPTGRLAPGAWYTIVVGHNLAALLPMPAKADLNALLLSLLPPA